MELVRPPPMVIDVNFVQSYDAQSRTERVEVQESRSSLTDIASSSRAGHGNLFWV